ncbi:MAG: hypothetical protein Q4B69_02500 [Slackia sp.]|nr:hypothetical protein [Slackia sp.]
MMPLLVSCIAVVVCAVLLKSSIKRYAPFYYTASFALVALYLAGVAGMLPTWFKGGVFLLMQKGTLPMAMFFVVMFIGVLPRGSKPRLALGPVRAELSVMACILICAHMIAYAMSYVPRVIGSALANPFIAIGLLAAVLLLVLLAVLGITSLVRVKSKMNAATWTKVQKSAYVFYGLIYVHVLALLLPSALSGGAAAKGSVLLYSVLFVAYAVLRAVRSMLDAKAMRSS